MFGLNRKQLFSLLVLIVALFAATEYVPPYLAAFQLNDFVRQEVKYAATARRTTDEIRGRIVQKARELEIPIGPRDVRIARRGPSFTVEVEYKFPIDMRVYRHDLVFRASESGEMFQNASH